MPGDATAVAATPDVPVATTASGVAARSVVEAAPVGLGFGESIPAEVGGVVAGLEGVLSVVPAAVAVLAVQALVGLLFARAAPAYASRVSDRIRQVPGHAFVLGLLVVLGGGFVVVVRWAAATGTLALPLAGFYLGLVASGSSLGTIALGAALADRLGGTAGPRLLAGRGAGSGWGVAASLGAGLLVGAPAHAVPAIGWTVTAFLSVLGVGAVAEWILDGHDADGTTVPDGRPYGPRP